MKFVFKIVKGLLSHWASKLLGAEAATDVLLTIAEAHAKNTKTDTDDKLVAVLKKYLSQ